MTVEKLLCLGTGFIAGIMISVIAFVCLADWLEEREKRKQGERGCRKNKT